MFSVITRKSKMIFDVCITCDTAHIDTIFKFLPHTRQYGCIDILHCCNDPCLCLGQRGHVAMVGRIPGLWRIPKEKNRRAYCQGTSEAIASVFGHFQTHALSNVLVTLFSHYIHYTDSHSLAAEMWITTKNNLLGKKFLSCSFYLYRFRKYVSYGFPVIHFCNSGVHYETPCTHTHTLYTHTHTHTHTHCTHTHYIHTHTHTHTHTVHTKRG